MISQRLAIACFALSGLVLALAGARILTGTAVGAEQLALGFAQGAFGLFFAYAALNFLQPDQLGHSVVFSMAAAGLAASSISQTVLMLLTSVLAMVGGASAMVSAIRFQLTRRRQPPTSLNNYYQEAVTSRRIRHDARQAALVAELDELASAFQRYYQRRSKPWGFIYRAPQGLYLCGPAGRGKTFLLDAFYQTLPTTGRKRYHFHEIMTRLLDELHDAQGSQRAVQQVAKALAKPGSLVCLDELNLLDLTGARLLLALLEAWWHQGTVVCISSNMTIANVFAGVALAEQERDAAVQRLTAFCQQWQLDSGQDYRANKLGAADLYQYPNTEQTPVRLQQIVSRLAEGELSSQPVQLKTLQVPCVSQAGGIAWFTYAELCERPLGYRQYLELVTLFPTIILSAVPQLTNEDAARRFAWLVELIYDAKKRLIVAADAPLDRLFSEQLSSTGESADFGKIVSRLREMQSSEYNYVLSTDA